MRAVVAAHVADKGADELDCNFFLRGVPGRQFAACGNHSSRIGSRTQAGVIWHLVQTRSTSSGTAAAAAGRARVYVASSSEPSSSPRVRRVVRALGSLGATVLTARGTP